MKTIFLILLVTILTTIRCQTTINCFDAQVDLGPFGHRLTIYDTRIQLWTNVTNCPSSSCSCSVTNNRTMTERFPVSFSTPQPRQGSVNMTELEPNTIYWFTISCDGATKQITKQFRTDNGRPSAPRNIQVSLNAMRLTITWSSPSIPAGPIDHYRLTYNPQRSVDFPVPSPLLFYIDEPYIAGTTVTYFLLACNKNLQNDSICSVADDGRFTYSDSSSTTSTQKSSTSASLNIISEMSMLLIVLSMTMFK